MTPEPVSAPSTSNRARLRRWVIGLALVLVGVVLIDALGVFDDTPFVKISHGNHSHYMPKERADGITAGNCPTRPPLAEEYLSPQCQIIRRVAQEGTTYHVPDGADPNVSISRFPTQPPTMFERIGPQGQVVLAGEDDH